MNNTPKGRHSNSAQSGHDIKALDNKIKSKHHAQNFLNFPPIMTDLMTKQDLQTRIDSLDIHFNSPINMPKVIIPDNQNGGKIPLSDKTNLKRSNSQIKKETTNEKDKKKQDFGNLKLEVYDENNLPSQKNDKKVMEVLYDMYNSSEKHSKLENAKNNQIQKINRRVSDAYPKLNIHQGQISPSSRRNHAIKQNNSRNSSNQSNRIGNFQNENFLKQAFCQQINTKNKKKRLNAINDNSEITQKSKLISNIREDNRKTVEEHEGNKKYKKQRSSRDCSLSDSNDKINNDKLLNAQLILPSNNIKNIHNTNITSSNRRKSNVNTEASGNHVQNQPKQLSNILDNAKWTELPSKDMFIDKLIQNEGGEVASNSIWNRYLTNLDQKPSLDNHLQRVEILFNNNECALQDLFSIRENLLSLYIRENLIDVKNRGQKRKPTTKLST